MTQRSRYLFMLIALCFVAFSGCEVKDAAPLGATAPRPALGAQVCDLNSTHWFPLQHSLTNGDWRGEYEFELQTGAYYSNDCLCRADYYEIGFTTIPANATVVARNIDGEIVNSTLHAPDPMGSEVYRLVIPAFEEMTDDLVTVFVDFEQMVGSLPLVAEAGGLCIVENYGGVGDPPTMFITPMRVQTENFPPGTGNTVKIWLPTAIATPVN